MVKHEVTPNAMDPSMLKSFWVSWRDGLIQIGKSKYRGANMLLQYQVCVIKHGVHVHMDKLD